MPATDLIQPAEHWFASRGWTPFPFQRQAWQAYLEGRDGLIHAPTGTGKTYAAWLGPLLEALAERDGSSSRRVEPLRVLWMTPLRALAGDTLASLKAAAAALDAPGFTIEGRTGDTSASRKAKQRARLPTAIVTTPESLSLLLTYPECVEQLKGVRAVIVDEWHELLGTKRGVQAELGLSAMRQLNPNLRTWGLSATLGNLDEAMQVLVGARAHSRPEPVLISAALPKCIEVETLIPDDIERFPWAGHLGTRMVPAVVKCLDRARTTLLFTNTRSQSEIWFRSLQRYQPDLIGHIGLHHGSIDRRIRERVENHLRAGTLRCVVCTSSLDLGVDFQPVEQVIQVGSPKGVARLLQRAGRSGHQPGKPSRIVCVPTNALELVEFSAAQAAITARSLESRHPLRLSLDVLVQHLVARAIGGGVAGVRLDDVLAEARATHAFAMLRDEQWAWCVDYVTRGGPALRAYPQFQRLVEVGEFQPGCARVASPAIARLHRLGAGTIVADPSMTVRCGRTPRSQGRALGTIEEGFIARLRIGDTFAFAGRLVRLTKVRDMTAYTVPATRLSGRVPSWNGSRMPLSAQLSAAVRAALDDAARARFEGPAMTAVAPLLRVQAAWSKLPRPGEVLIERAVTPDGYHAFVYPLEGRLVHEGLAALAAYRLAKATPRTFTMACNDYGFELCCPDPWDADVAHWQAVFDPANIEHDVLDCLNATELAKRQFREIARVSGLMTPTFPGQPRRASHAQASSEMFFDVLSEFEPENLLLAQARREVLERQLEFDRLRTSAARLAGATITIVSIERLTPLAFPLWADRLREQLSTEAWSDRVKRMVAVLEDEADRVPRRGKAASRKRA